MTDLLALALSAVRAHKLRSFLSTLGIAIGVDDGTHRAREQPALFESDDVVGRARKAVIGIGHDGEEACALAVELKKTFMDEWTGVPDDARIETLAAALEATFAGLEDSLRT